MISEFYLLIYFSWHLHTCGAVMWVIGSPIAYVMLEMNQMLTGMAGPGKWCWGSSHFRGDDGLWRRPNQCGGDVASLKRRWTLNFGWWARRYCHLYATIAACVATFISPKKFKRDAYAKPGQQRVLWEWFGISEGADPICSGWSSTCSACSGCFRWWRLQVRGWLYVQCHQPCAMWLFDRAASGWWQNHKALLEH